MIKSQNTQVKPFQRQTTSAAESDKYRSEWRQRLIDVESVIKFGIRLDSTFFIHFFVGSAVIAAATLL